MDFTLTREQESIRDSVRDLCLRSISPIADEIENESKIPDNLITKLAKLGLFGLPFTRKYGGSGSGFLSATLALEELSRASGAVAMLVGMNYLAGIPLDLYGTEEQKKQFLKPMCRGVSIGSFAFTESATGSDPRALHTRAIRENEEWVLNGKKRFITAGDMDGVIVMSAHDGKGVSTFIGDKNTTGYSVIKSWQKLGMHGISLVDIDLTDYRVPLSSQLGASGTGFNLLLDTVALGKMNTCAIILGCAQAALDEAVKYARERTAHGRPLVESQNIRSMIAEMAVKIEASRWMTYRLAVLADEKRNIRAESAAVKIFVTEAAVEIVNKAFLIHGAYAYVTDYKIERLLRDIYLGEIVEGSNEVQKAIVANNTLKS